MAKHKSLTRAKSSKPRVIRAQAAAIDPDQAWFWTDTWQAGEREVDADIAAGRITTYDNVEALIADLDRADQPAAKKA